MDRIQAASSDAQIYTANIKQLSKKKLPWTSNLKTSMARLNITVWNTRSALSPLTCHIKVKKETRLKSYIGACDNHALFITSNPGAKLSTSNISYLISQPHFQRLRGTLPVLFSLSQFLALLTITERRMY